MVLIKMMPFSLVQVYKVEHGRGEGRSSSSSLDNHIFSMLSRAITIFAAVAATFTGVLGSGVIVPLYIDPAGTSCSAWTPLLNA